MSVKEISECRVCGSPKLERVLDLGRHAISDFVVPRQQVERVPLVLMRCDECTLVQLRHTVDRERLYRRYWYRSGTNESMIDALLDVAKDPWCHSFLSPGDHWLDIGANDGTLLGLVGWQYPGIHRIGVEPSESFLLDSGWQMKPGDEQIHAFFPPPDWIEPKPCKVITSVAMFYDLDDPNEFVAAIKKWLHPEGVWIIQMSTLGQMLDTNAFDNICHEHLEYYSLGSLQNLLSRHDLHIAAFSANEVNGGSMRIVVRHGTRQSPWTDFPKLGTRAELEIFASRVSSLRERTRTMLGELLMDGKLVLGYGASTKGNTLLQYYGIGPDLLPAIADRNPDKCGQVTAGSNIPIISEKEMRERQPDYLMTLPWHFLNSFIQRERALLETGMRFIVPLPELRVVGLGDVATACLGQSDG